MMHSIVIYYLGTGKSMPILRMASSTSPTSVTPSPDSRSEMETMSTGIGDQISLLGLLVLHQALDFFTRCPEERSRHGGHVEKHERTLEGTNEATDGCFVLAFFSEKYASGILSITAVTVDGRIIFML